MTGLPKLLRDLDAALDALGDEAMALGQLDGFVAAIILSPRPVPPEEWLPFVWSFNVDDVDEDAPPPPLPSDASTQALAAQILAHRDATEWLLRHAPDDYAPVVDHDPRTGETLWEFWIEGFEFGLSLRPEAWAQVIERPEPDDAVYALALLLTLYQIMTKDPELEQTPEQVADLEANGAEMITGCVAELARDRFGPAPRAEPVRRSKVGRNDPCPCGSGQKYKKCCGAAAA